MKPPKTISVHFDVYWRVCGEEKTCDDDVNYILFSEHEKEMNALARTLGKRAAQTVKRWTEDKKECQEHCFCKPHHGVYFGQPPMYCCRCGKSNRVESSVKI